MGIQKYTLLICLEIKDSIKLHHKHHKQHPINIQQEDQIYQ